MTPTVLVIDVGSRACRTTALRGSTVVASARRDTPTHVPDDAPTGREWDPKELWDAIVACIREVAAPAQPDAVVATSQRLAYVFADEALEARYVGPNADARGFVQSIALAKAHGPDLAAISRRRPPIVLVPARWAWFRETKPEVTDATRWILPLSDWIGARLTGIPAAEPSNAADTGLLDVAARSWSPKILKIADIEADFVPPLRNPGDLLGEVTADAAAATGLREGTRVAVAGSDTACGLAGMGVDTPGTAATLAGSTSPVEVVVDTPVDDESGRLWINCLLPENRWAVDASTGEAGIAQRWLKEMMGIPSTPALDALAADADSSGGVMWHLSAPIDFSDLMLGETGQARFARPLLVLGPTRAQLARAFFENLAFSVRRALGWTAEVRRHDGFHLGGGFCGSPVYRRVLADTLGEVVHTHDIHVTARGAAQCAHSMLGLDPPEPPAPEPVEPEGNLETEYAAWSRELARLEDLGPRFSLLVQA